jgi:hypothetical protein
MRPAQTGIEINGRYLYLLIGADAVTGREAGHISGRKYPNNEG